MSIHSKITRWRNVGQFCSARVADYSALFLVELAQTKAKVMRELIAMVALAVGVLFTLSFLCFAVIATAWQTPYFLAVVWGHRKALAAHFSRRACGFARPKAGRVF